MGAGESSNPIRNMDKRTARREYKDDFSRAIGKFRQQFVFPDTNTGVEDQTDLSTWSAGDIRVFVRKRPIFKRETDLGEFDVVSCVGADTVVVHDARMHTDMKRQFINNHSFSFDRVFGEITDNRFVYTHTTAPLVTIALEGGYSTCMV